MKTITHSELIDKITALKGAAIVGIEALTDAKAHKANPFGTILKQSRAVVSVGANYENSVNRQGAREENTNAGSFQAAPLQWGQWMVPNKLIEHKGTVYLRTQTAPGQRANRPPVVKFRDVSGRFLSRDEVRPFLPAKVASARQADFGNKGEVQVRTFKLDSILRLRFGGETFKVVK